MTFFFFLICVICVICGFILLMTELIHSDILIVGSGPAGTSTALHLVKSDPSWAGRIVIVDKAVHPRDKRIWYVAVASVRRRLFPPPEDACPVPPGPVRDRFDP